MIEKQGLTINIPKLNKSLFIEEKRLYKKLHNSDLIDARIENLLNGLKVKYSCDYIAITLLNQNCDLAFSNIGHDKWHNYYWKNYMQNCPTPKITSQLKKGENGFLFFRDYGGTSLSERAEIVGEYKEGFTVMFHNDNSGNKIQFAVTFGENKTIGDFCPRVFKKFLKDLKSVESVIDDFVEYFDKNGNIDDSSELKKFIKAKNYQLPI